MEEGRHHTNLRSKATIWLAYLVIRSDEAHVQRTCGVDQHRCLQRLSRKKIPNRTTSDTKEGASRHSIEKARDEHGLNILCDRARDEPDEEECERYNIDWSTPVELWKLVSEDKGIEESGIDTSDNGLSTIGPTPNPITKSDSPRVATICEHLNSTVI